MVVKKGNISLVIKAWSPGWQRAAAALMPPAFVYTAVAGWNMDSAILSLHGGHWWFLPVYHFTPVNSRSSVRVCENSEDTFYILVPISPTSMAVMALYAPYQCLIGATSGVLYFSSLFSHCYGQHGAVSAL